MEINKLTLQLLDEGYTKENPPDWVTEWNDFYGGWQYTCKTKLDMVWETPCGLLAKGLAATGTMSYGGVTWTAENDNATTPCPKFDGIPCELNHPALRNFFLGKDKIAHCSCKRTNKTYSYENSVDEAHDEVWKDSDSRFELFNETMGTRACRRRSVYNRHTKEWKMFYDPLQCGRDNFNHCIPYCHFLQMPLSPKKANVYYDIKFTSHNPAEGLFPEKECVSITKGVKVFDKQTSITICEAFVEHGLESYKADYAAAYGRLRYRIAGCTREIVNVRVESRPSRDLMQDLADVAAGIEVKHESVSKKALAEQKRQRKEARKAANKRKIEKKIIAVGYDELDKIWRIRAGKHLTAKEIDALEFSRMLKVKDPEPVQVMLDGF